MHTFLYHCACFVGSAYVLFLERVHLCGFDLQIHDMQLSWPVMSAKWGGETKWKHRLWQVLVYLLWVCVSVFLCLCTMALLRCGESQAPWCLACWTGVSRGTFGWIRWLLCPFQVWLLHGGTSNMNLEAIKEGWIVGCPLPILLHHSDAGSTQSHTYLDVEH